jgi:glycosyltransferase involved in cell wall biosynthesis
MCREAACCRLRGRELPESKSLSLALSGNCVKKRGWQSSWMATRKLTKRISASLLIVGKVRDGEDKKFLEEFQSTNLQLPITITGHVPHKDLPAYYSLMDVFVHPSLRDGMPNALLEAMACGKPVIATPVGGAADVIEDGKNGIFINVNDANALSEKIQELLDNPEKCAALGKNARESIIGRFTPEKELQANLNVYRTIGAKV